MAITVNPIDHQKATLYAFATETVIWFSSTVARMVDPNAPPIVSSILVAVLASGICLFSIRRMRRS